MKKKTIITFLTVNLLILASCQISEKKAQNREDSIELKSFTSGLVKQDTTDVCQLVNSYMTYTQNKQYSDAAAMLFKPNPENAWKEPLQLDNKEMEEVITLLKQFPIKSYEITKLEFKTAIDNEVKCTFISEKPAEGKRSFTFRPMNYLGKWCLCLMN